jgi:hypothetical protein
VFGVGTRVCPAVVLRHDRLDRSLPRHLELDAGFCRVDTAWRGTVRTGCNTPAGSA